LRALGRVDLTPANGMMETSLSPLSSRNIKSTTVLCALPQRHARGRSSPPPRWNPNHHEIASLGYREAVTCLVRAHCGRRMSVYRHAASTVHHCRRRGCSSAPSVQQGAPLGEGLRGECNRDDATTRDLAVGELSPVKHGLLFWFADGWVPLTVGPICQPECCFEFLIYFHRFKYQLQKSYLELEISKLSEQNFVGFLIKCSI